MAELHIQRRKNVWPWVIALIVVLLLIGGALMWMDGNRVGATVAPPANPTATALDGATDTRAAGATASTTDADAPPPSP